MKRKKERETERKSEVEKIGAGAEGRKNDYNNSKQIGEERDEEKKDAEIRTRRKGNAQNLGFGFV